MIDTSNLFLCDHEKNTKCPKISCHIYGGPCRYTAEKQYELELTPMDKLMHMLVTQGTFQKRLNPDFCNMDEKERVAFIKEHSIHLNQEINEMLYELPFFKPWKDYSNMSPEAIEVAFAKARMECIDAWHFFMNIMLALGFSAEEFYEMYLAKNSENHRRQDEGYTADKSYRNQSVEEVMNHE